MTGVLGIVLSLLALMYFAYRGVSVLLLAPITAMLALSFHPSVPWMASYTQIFLPAMAKFLGQYFPLFALGAIFGKLMSDSGAAYSIGAFLIKRLGTKYALLAVVLACGLLTYGGVSVFVVAFTIYPIGNALFHRADIPKKLLPGAITLGSFTFTMTALPGTPSIHNAIPMAHFGTDTFAAPVVGLITGVFMLLAGIWWLNWRLNLLRRRGEGYGESFEEFTVTRDQFPTISLAILPLIMVIVLNYLFQKWFIPRWDVSYLAEAKFGAIALANVSGTWSLIMALSLAILFICLFLRHYLKDVLASLNSGTNSCLFPIFNTASEVGYGAIIASLASFVLIKDALIAMAPNSPLVGMSVAINALAGITGSASGGLSIALDALGKTFVEMADKHHLSHEILHRLATLSSGGFDSLPHNGAVISLLAICGMTHKKSYLDIFVIATVIPVIAIVGVLIFY